VQLHWPAALQTSPAAQLPVPQVPPQPSGPQAFPTQSGAHAHCPAAVQVSPAWQPGAQLPPHPSPPQTFPEQLGVQVAAQVVELTPVLQNGRFGLLQAPQLPPHPSGPHCFPPQLGVQTH
jgi:hypothetical protein